MSVILNVGLDLGSDTLKIAFAYESEEGVSYGKLMKEGLMTQVALPAIAYYDTARRMWLFGDGVEKGEEKSFVTVVKIKSLLSLLLANPDKNIQKKNSKAYFQGNDFPKFYFPVRRKMLSDFSEMVEEEMTFRVEGKTPASVCEDFFVYARNMVYERVARLSSEKGVSFDRNLRIALVHPSRTGKAYIEEMTRLAQRAFGAPPFKVLSSTKALSMYAFQRGMIAKGESLLVFDMGEEDISVVKASLLQNGKLVVDGADGHLPPCNVGGNDIDDAVAAYIEGCIHKRETVGTPSYGTEGHIQEKGLHSKQYLFMKDIKKAKMILSMPLREGSVFEGGVPVAVSRDLYIQRKLTREEFCGCIGVAAGDGVARKIVDYILEELARPVNAGVSKVFLSGGLVETYSVFEYIKKEVAKKRKGIEFYTFDDWKNKNDGFTILSFEDSTYAPAVGGAIVALKNYDVQTVIALSYATWMSVDTVGNGLGYEKFLSIFADKGQALPKEETYFHTEPAWFGNNGNVSEIRDEEIYSTIITREEISRRKYAGKLARGQYYTENSVQYLLIGENKNTERRRMAEKHIGLKVVSGEGGVKIRFYYRGRRVELQGRLGFTEGVLLDPEGIATPTIRNETDRNRGSIQVRYIDKYGNSDFSTGYPIVNVPARDVEIRFEGIVDNFVMQEFD